MKISKCNHKYIDDYLNDIENGKTQAPKEIHQAIPFIRSKLAEPECGTMEKTEKADENAILK